MNAEEAKKIYEKAHIASQKGDVAKALKYYMQAAEAGIVPAMVSCGNMYLERNDAENALQWFERAAEFDDVVAINNIGYIHEMDENFEQAFKWYKRSADLGDVVAMLNLAALYHDGLGTRKSKKQFDFWVKKAESTTDTESIKAIARYYADAGNFNRAIEFFNKAIALGDIGAFGDLGGLYFDLESYKNAENCYRDGARMGDIQSMMGLGVVVTPTNFEEAKYWLTKAANLGNSAALRLLGGLYFEYKQYPQALRYYRKAINAGECDVEEDLQQVKRLLKNSKQNCKLKLRSPD